MSQHKQLNQAEIRGSLERHIKAWCDKMQETDQFPEMYMSDNAHEHIAAAAWAVLQAEIDTYATLQTDGMLAGKP